MWKRITLDKFNSNWPEIAPFPRMQYPIAEMEESLIGDYFQNW